MQIASNERLKTTKKNPNALARKLDVIGLRRKREIRFTDSQKPQKTKVKHGGIIKCHRERRRGVNPRTG